MVARRVGRVDAHPHPPAGVPVRGRLGPVGLGGDVVVLVEFFGEDLASGAVGELGDDEVLVLEELVECVGGVFGLEEFGGVGAGVGLQVVEEGFVFDVKVWLGTCG